MITIELIRNRGTTIPKRLCMPPKCTAYVYYAASDRYPTNLKFYWNTFDVPKLTLYFQRLPRPSCQMIVELALIVVVLFCLLYRHTTRQFGKWESLGQ